jgi:hypothetical protein
MGVLCLIATSSPGASLLTAETISELQQPLDAAAAETTIDEKDKTLRWLRAMAALAEARAATAAASPDMVAPFADMAAEFEVEHELLTSKPFAVWRQHDVALRCLLLVEAFLSEWKHDGRRDAVFDELIREVVLPAIGKSSTAIRYLGVVCFGLACLHNRNLAVEHFYLFSQIITHDTPLIRTTAVKVLFDFLLLFDLKGVQFCDPTDGHPKSMLDTAAGLLERCLDYQYLRLLCCEGLIKLIHLGIAPSRHERWCSRLLVEAFSRWKVEDIRLRIQKAVRFLFSSLAKRSLTGWKSVSFVFHGLLFAIRAPEVSVHAEAADHLRDMAVLVLDALRETTSPAKNLEMFFRRLTVDLLREVWENPRGSEGKQLPQLLSIIDLPEPGGLSDRMRTHFEHIARLLSRLTMAVQDKIAVRCIEEFAKRVSAIVRKPKRQPKLSEESEDTQFRKFFEEEAELEEMVEKLPNKSKPEEALMPSSPTPPP